MHQFSPLELIASHPWKRALFTTFALSASFAEAVVLDALLRRGVTDIKVLCDPVGLRMALQEGGAVRIGREYALEPVAVKGGCFHPKLLVLADDELVHVLVGSGNLTFGGWCANLECIDHLHAGGSAQALTDVADFFETLASEPRASHGISDDCLDIALRLRRAAGTGTDDGTRRILHSLGRPLAEQLAASVNDLGGAVRMIGAAPFWDGGKAMDQLARDLGLTEYFAHVPERAVGGFAGMDWPRESTMARPATVAELTGEAALNSEGMAVRPLHAKLIEIVCKDGRLLLSGSANATSAALHSGESSMSGNVEVSSLRIERLSPASWNLVATLVPGTTPSIGDDEPDRMRDAVLRAELRGLEIVGQVVSPWPGGRCDATLHVGHLIVPLGLVTVDERGHFAVAADMLDPETSLSGRMQLRLRLNDHQAEGFVTHADFSALSRRTGGKLPSILNAIKGLHTPEDVLAIIDFIQQNPEALRTPDPFGRRGQVTESDRPDPKVSADYLNRLRPIEGEKDEVPASPTETDRVQASVQAVLSKLMASMATTRVRSEDEEDAADPTEARQRKRTAKFRSRADIRFGQYFQHMTAGIDDDATYLNAVWMTQFVCVATGHRAARVFLERLIQIGLEHELGPGASQVVAWCILAAATADGGPAAASLARSQLLTLGLDPDAEPAAEYKLDGFLDVLAPGASTHVALERIREITTVHEEARSLEARLLAGATLHAMPALEACQEWPELAKELTKNPARRRIHFVERPVKACPKCNISLRHDQQVQLSRRGICVSDCHGVILARNSR